MGAITLYDATDGRILGLLRVPDEAESVYDDPGISGYIAGHYSGNDYYVDITADPPVAVEKIANASTGDVLAVPPDEATPAVINNISSLTTATIVSRDSGATLDTVVVTDGSLSVTFDTAGYYDIILNCLPQLTKTYEVVVS